MTLTKRHLASALYNSGRFATSGDAVKVEDVNYYLSLDTSVSVVITRHFEDFFKNFMTPKIESGFITSQNSNTIDITAGEAMVSGRWLSISSLVNFDPVTSGLGDATYYIVVSADNISEDDENLRQPALDSVSFEAILIGAYDPTVHLVLGEMVVVSNTISSYTDYGSSRTEHIDDIVPKNGSTVDIYTGSFPSIGIAGQFASQKFNLLNGTDINEFSIDGTLAGNSDDAVPTEQAVKTYIDGGGVAGSGFVTLDTTQSITAEKTFAFNTIHQDGIRAYYGDTNKAYVTHTGTNFHIVNTIGTLFIQQSAAGGDIIMDSADKLIYRDGSSAFETIFDFDFQARTRIIGSLTDNITSTHFGNFTFPDGDYLYFGTGNDFSIIHTGGVLAMYNTVGHWNIQQSGGDMTLDFSSSSLLIRDVDDSYATLFEVDTAVATRGFKVGTATDAMPSTFYGDMNLASTNHIDMGVGQLKFDTDGTNGYIKATARQYFEITGTGILGHVDAAGWDFASAVIVNGITTIKGSNGTLLEPLVLSNSGWTAGEETHIGFYHGATGNVKYSYIGSELSSSTQSALVFGTYISGATREVGRFTSDGSFVIGGAVSSTFLFDNAGTSMFRGEVTFNKVDLINMGTLRFSNNVNAVDDTYSAPIIYSTGSSGGSYPFSTAGNLIISPRLSGAVRDVVFLTDSTGQVTFSDKDAPGTIGIAITPTTGVMNFGNGGYITSQDADTTWQFGRTLLRSAWSDYMTISHRDMTTTANYALSQNSSGATYLNANTGQELSFAVGAVVLGIATATSMTYSSGVDLALTSGALTLTNGNLELTTVSNRMAIGAGVISRVGIQTAFTFTDVGTSIYGIQSGATLTGGSNNTNYFSFWTNTVINNAGQALTNSYGLYINNPTVTAGSIANNMGIYINRMTGGTSSNYAMSSTDGDMNYRLGRALIASPFADYAGFSHRDMSTTLNYALIQGAVGDTYLNSASGQVITFRISNSTKMTLSTSNLDLGSGIQISSADEAITHTLGRAHIGFMIAGLETYAGFKHRDVVGSNYAFLQSSAGQTFVNSSATTSFNIAGNNYMNLTSTEFNMVVTLDITKVGAGGTDDFLIFDHTGNDTYTWYGDDVNNALVLKSTTLDPIISFNRGGNVGIGTVVNNNPLDVYESVAGFARLAEFKNTSTSTSAYGEIKISSDDGYWRIGVGDVGSSVDYGYMQSSSGFKLQYSGGSVALDVDTGGIIDLPQAKLTIAGLNGSANQVLQTDGAGNITWGTPAGAGDVLLAATQTFTGVNTFNNTMYIHSTATANRERKIWDSGAIAYYDLDTALTSLRFRTAGGAGYTSMSDRLIIQQSASTVIGVGIVPLRFIHGSAGAGTRVDLQLTYSALGETTNDGIQLGIQAAGAYLWNFENSQLYFATNNLRRMTIEADGNVGINVDAPERMLHVKTATVDDGITIEGTDAGTSFSPRLRLWRNSASPLAGDLLGLIQFDGEDSIGSRNDYAAIGAQIINTTTGNEDADLIFYTSAAGSNAETMRLSSIGKLSLFTVGGDADIYFETTTATASARLTFKTVDQEWYILNHGTGDHLSFYDADSSAYRFTVEITGHVGISNGLSFNAPTKPLHIYDTANGDTTMKIENTSTGSSADVYSVYDLSGTNINTFMGSSHGTMTDGSTDGGFIRTWSNHGIFVVANSNGVKLTSGATAWVSASDIRWKTKIKELSVLDQIMGMKVLEYNLLTEEVLEEAYTNMNTGKEQMRRNYTGKKIESVRQIGVSAQDLLANGFDLLVDQSNPDKFSVDYSHMSAINMGGIIELKREKDSDIAELKAENVVLRNELSEIRKMINALSL